VNIYKIVRKRNTRFGYRKRLTFHGRGRVDENRSRGSENEIGGRIIGYTGRGRVTKETGRNRRDEKNISLGRPVTDSAEEESARLDDRLSRENYRGTTFESGTIVRDRFKQFI